MNHYKKFLVTTAIYIGLLYSITGCLSTQPQKETCTQPQEEKQPSTTLRTLEEKLTPGKATTREANRLLKMVWENTVDPNKL